MDVMNKLKQDFPENFNDVSKIKFFDKTEFVIYKDDIFHNNGKQWININKKYNSEKLRTFYIKSLIDSEKMTDRELELSYKQFMMEATLNGGIDDRDINQNVAVFTNGFYDLDQKKFIKSTKLPFTLSQKPYDYDEKATHDIAEQFINKVAGEDKTKRQLLLEIIGSAFFSHNPSIFAILHSEHSTSGKGTLVELIRSITSSVRELDYNGTLEGRSQFGLGALSGTDCAFFDELPEIFGKGTSEKIKGLADTKNVIEIEEKGKNRRPVINSTTLIGLTNKNIVFDNFDNAMAMRIIYFNNTLNSDGVYFFNEKEIRSMLNDKNSFQYIARLAIEAYQKVYDSGKARNSKFSLTKEHFDWVGNQISAVEDMIEYAMSKNQELNNLIQAKETVWTNKFLRDVFDKCEFYKNNKDYKFIDFKNNLISYFREKKCLVTEISTVIKGKRERGIRVNWVMCEE